MPVSRFRRTASPSSSRKIAASATTIRLVMLSGMGKECSAILAVLCGSGTPPFPLAAPGGSGYD